MHSTKLVFIVFMLAVVPLVGCEAEPIDDSCEHIFQNEIDPEGERHAYVVDSVTLPSSASQALSLGMDLDGDELGRTDNALGQVLSAVYGYYAGDIDGPLAAMINDGRILHVLELQTRSLENADGVGATVFIANDRDDDAADNFSGFEPFTIDESVVTRSMRGELVGGNLSVSLGSIPLEIAMPGVDEPGVLRLEAVRIEATVTSERIVGKIGGVLRDEGIEDLLTLVHAAAEATIARDCVGANCEPDSAGEFYRDLFDRDEDHLVSYEELSDSNIIKSLLAPDVDLYNDAGSLTCGGGDGVKDSLSVGVGFTAVRALVVQ